MAKEIFPIYKNFIFFVKSFFLQHARLKIKFKITEKHSFDTVGNMYFRISSDTDLYYEKKTMFPKKLMQ